MRSAKSKYQPQNEADEAKETHKVISGRDAYGHKTINQYVILRLLGVGAYGKVKLCQNMDDKKFYVNNFDYVFFYKFFRLLNHLKRVH